MSYNGSDEYEDRVVESSQQQHLQAIRDWFGGNLGQQLLGTERAILEQLLSTYFGYHLLQLSVQEQNLCDASPIHNQVNIGLLPHDRSQVSASPNRLPFEDDSIDVAVMHHMLDFVDNPQELLREMTRVVRPMGRLVMIGFNPLSLWGVWKALARIRTRPPWNGGFIRPDRMMDWMNLLDFKIDRAQYCHYGLPIAARSPQRPDFSKGLSRNANLPVGGVYVIVAQKHVGTMTQIRPSWGREERAFGQLSVVRTAGPDMLSRQRPSRRKVDPPLKD